MDHHKKFVYPPPPARTGTMQGQGRPAWASSVWEGGDKT